MNVETVIVNDHCTYEEQALPAGLPYTDYGSRFFDPDHCTWLSPDPLSGKYPGVYPYAFCAGDPVNYVDPDGEDPIYARRKGIIDIIADDGKNDGRSYLVRGRVKRDVLKQSAGTGIYKNVLIE